MNSFGRILRIHIFGESHGPSVGIIIDGCPAGLSLQEEDFTTDLERRKGGVQKGTTPRKENDKPIYLSGLFNGHTTGAPLTIIFENNNTRSSDYEKIKSIPRPGHADFVAHQKFKGYEDYRGGGHFSGRLTVCLVAAGVVAKKILDQLSLNLTTGSGEKRDAISNYISTPPKLPEEYAPGNRNESTGTEGKLWEEIRNRKINGCKFRRHHPVEGYIPDFVCLEKKLIIEFVKPHDAEVQQKIDRSTTEWLQKYGYRMMKFTNEEVMTDMPEVIEKISAALQESASSNYESLEKGADPEIQNITIHARIIEIGGETDIDKGLQKAIDKKDSVGGIIECVVTDLPVGLGEPFFDSLESLVAHAVFSIPAIKGIEFGAGFEAAKMFGSEHNDSIIDAKGRTETNYAGGVIGGISNGNELIFRVVVKPTSSTPMEQASWNWETEEIERFSVKGRHDLCIALRVPPVLEAVTAIVLADAMMIAAKL